MRKGFTLVEILIVTSIMAVLAAMAFFMYGRFYLSVQLNENTALIIQALKTARERSAASYNDSRHGIYFDIDNDGADKYILYQGDSYVSRNINYDREFFLENSLMLSASNFVFTGNDVDINFAKISGVPDNTGTIILTHQGSGMRHIGINSVGLIEEN